MTDLMSKIAEITEVMTLPDVMIRINRTISSDNTSASDIAEIINSDIALSTKMLKLVNSPFYGFSKKITSINYAIVILGFKAVRNLTMTAYILDMAERSTHDFDSKRFWEFSINSGVIAEYLCHYQHQELSNDAYISGLLHNIGILILFQHFPDDFSAVFEYSQSNNCTLLDAENHLLDFNHIEIGKIILENWNFPEKIIDVCQHYPQPDNYPSDIMASVISVADNLCRALQLGNPGDMAISEISSDTLIRIGIPEDNIEQILRNIIIKTQNTSQLIG